MRKVLFVLMNFLIACNGLVMVRDRQTEKEFVEAKPSKGETLFKSKCSVCHKPDIDFTGPGLAETYQHWPDKKALYDFVKNPAAAKKTKYVKEMFENYRPTIMTGFPDLTNAEIDSILVYCRDFTQPVTY